MMEAIGITICRDCKKVFFGMPKRQMRCPSCRGWNIMLLSNSGIVDAVIGDIGDDMSTYEDAVKSIKDVSNNTMKTAYEAIQDLKELKSEIENCIDDLEDDV